MAHNKGLFNSVFGASTNTNQLTNAQSQQASQAGAGNTLAAEEAKTLAKYYKELMAARYHAPPDSYLGSRPDTAPPAPAITTDTGRRGMLAMRLHMTDHTKLPFPYMSTALTDDKIFVFIVIDGQAVTLSDERAIFPSDGLIAQLRLLLP